MIQPSLFEEVLPPKTVANERLVQFALGEFQKRGKELAERELPLDRLLGAVRRSAEHFQTAEPSDEEIAETLTNLGAKVIRIPTFFAKHPFRVKIPNDLAEKSLIFLQEELAKEKSVEKVQRSA